MMFAEAVVPVTAFCGGAGWRVVGLRGAMHPMAGAVYVVIIATRGGGACIRN